MKWVEITPTDFGYYTRVSVAGRVFAPCYQVRLVYGEARCSVDRHISRLCIEDPNLAVAALPLDANSVDLEYLDQRFPYVSIEGRQYQTPRWAGAGQSVVSYGTLWSSLERGVLFNTGGALGSWRQQSAASLFTGSVGGVQELSHEVSRALERVRYLLGTKKAVSPPMEEDRVSIGVLQETVRSPTVPSFTKSKTTRQHSPAHARAHQLGRVQELIISTPLQQTLQQTSQIAREITAWRSPIRVRSSALSEEFKTEDIEEAEPEQQEALSRSQISPEGRTRFKRPCVVFRNVALFFGDASFTMRPVGSRETPE